MGIAGQPACRTIGPFSISILKIFLKNNNLVNGCGRISDGREKMLEALWRRERLIIS